MTEIRPITAADEPALAAFVHALPEGDRTFFKEEVSDLTVKRWCEGVNGSRRWVLSEGETVKGVLALIPGTAWSSHVAELRLVVGAQHRRQGVGRRLARHGLLEGVRLGYGKLVVEVVADRTGDIAMFTGIGFRPEALLERHIIDRTGQTRDLVVLAHQVDDQAAAMGTLGIDEAVAAGGAA
jgi:ribosomal protein S18 acetylase RimI-like enzyme